ncbi:hypothetical protein RFI_33569, partial [Reticulomyxa filosa]
SDWEKVESLSKGECYYFNRSKNETVKTMPDELKDKKVKCEFYREQGVKFAERPSQFPTQGLPPIDNVVTNAYFVTGKLLTTPIAHYIVEFDPPVDPENSLLRQQI